MDPAGGLTQASCLATCALTPPTQGEEGKTACTQGHQHIPPDSPGATVMSATAKPIHGKGPACIQSQDCWPCTAMNCDSSPLPLKRMRDKTNVHTCGRKSGRPQQRAWAEEVAHPRYGGGGWGGKEVREWQHLAQPHAQAQAAQPLESIPVPKLWSPRSANVTFQEQPKK
jgi:hypothetical protein